MAIFKFAGVNSRLHNIVDKSTYTNINPGDSHVFGLSPPH